MTDGDGAPFHRQNGDVIRHTLKPGEDPDTIARILTREVRKQLHGDSAGFNRRLELPSWGIAQWEHRKEVPGPPQKPRDPPRRD